MMMFDAIIYTTYAIEAALIALLYWYLFVH